MGEGFHSNDGRSAIDTSIPVSDPTAGPNQKVTPLVRSKGFEVGARTAVVQGLQSSLAFFQLDFDSELQWDGDKGETSPGRPSRRRGFEFTNHYTPVRWLTVDLDFAYTVARFTASDPTDPTIKNHVPGANEGVGSLGVSVHDLGRCFGSLWLRYLGPYALIEDNSQRSQASTLLEGQVGYKFSRHLTVMLQGFNLLNTKASDIEYYYASRLSTEPAGSAVNDIHFKPVEPLNVRLSLVYNF